MSGIYIPGAKIPDGDYVRVLMLHKDGTCVDGIGNVFKVILVPPHGDLIDASEKIRVQMYDDEHEDFHTEEMTIDDLLSKSWVQAYAFPVIPATEEG